jgi:hypothetical protein
MPAEDGPEAVEASRTSNSGDSSNAESTLSHNASDKPAASNDDSQADSQGDSQAGKPCRVPAGRKPKRAKKGTSDEVWRESQKYRITKHMKLKYGRWLGPGKDLQHFLCRLCKGTNILACAASASAHAKGKKHIKCMVAAGLNPVDHTPAATAATAGEAKQGPTTADALAEMWQKAKAAGDQRMARQLVSVWDILSKGCQA